MTHKPPNSKKVYLRKGPVTTTNTWDRPTTILFDKWIECMKNYIKHHKINMDMYVCGKFLENPSETWDIDIILTHSNIRYFTLHELKKVRDIMIYGMQIGFDKFNLLIDMACYLPFNNNGNFWYSCDDFLKNGRIYSHVLYLFDRIEQDNKIIQDFNKEKNTHVNKICDDLFLVSKLSPSEKHIERIKHGNVYTEPKQILL